MRLALLATLIAAAPTLAGQDTPVIPATQAAPVPPDLRKHGLAKAPAKAPGHIRLATYNIHELYDSVDDPSLSGRQDDLRFTMPDNRLEATAEVIHRLDADILALQEVESLDALTWYRDTRLADMGYTHLASIDVGHAIGMEQAVLSRFPIIDSKVWTDMVIGVEPATERGQSNPHAGEPLRFRRAPLMVELDLSGRPAHAEAAPDGEKAPPLPEAERVTLLIVHEKTGSDAAEWRRAETSGILKIVAELGEGRPDRRVIVLGDFAEPQGEGHVKPLLGAGFTDAFAKAASDPAVDRAEIATNISGARDCLILLDPHAAALAADTPRFVLGTPIPPKGVSRNIAYRMPGFASDHYPLAIDLVRPHE